MTTLFFSIIVPCYNTEKYLPTCIMSVLNQKYSDFELLLINDGSTDNTLNICKNFANKDKRIIVINKKNEGVSCARNTGLDYSKGKWIIFLDADDWLENNALEVIYNHIKLDSFDLLGYNSFSNWKNKQWKKNSIIPNKLIREGNQLKWLKYSMLFPYYDYKINNVYSGEIRAVWGKAFKKEIIDKYHIRFEEKIKIAEDAVFCYDYLEKANKAILINEYLVHYRLYSSSTMRRFTPNIVDINNSLLEVFYQRIEKKLQHEDFKIIFQGLASNCIFTSLKLFYLHPENTANFNSRIKEFKASIGTNLYKKALSYTKVKYLPLGKREIVYCINHNWILLAFIIAWISIIYIKLKNIANVN